jgi:hypothetical protein
MEKCYLALYNIFHGGESKLSDIENGDKQLDVAPKPVIELDLT